MKVIRALALCVISFSLLSANEGQLEFLDRPIMAENSDLTYLYGGKNFEVAPNTLTEALRIKIFPHTDNRAPHREDSVHFYFKLVSDQPLTLYDGDRPICYSRVIQVNSENTFTSKFYCIDQDRIIDFEINDGVSLASYSVQAQENSLIQVKRYGHENNYFYPGAMEIIPYRDRVILVNIVGMEQYIRGVVPAEIFVSWPTDTVAAQAVAARTYAYYHFLRLSQNPDRIFHFDDTTSYQVYIGDYRKLKEEQWERLYFRWLNFTDDSSESAQTMQQMISLYDDILIHLTSFFASIERTEGQIMLEEKEEDTRLFQAYFHAASGGGTVNAGDLGFVDCTPCKEVADYSPEEIENDSFAQKYLKPSEFWLRQRSLAFMEKALKRAGLLKSNDVLKSLALQNDEELGDFKTRFGHYVRMPLLLANGTKVVPGYAFKSAMQINNIKYDVTIASSGEYIFNGRGYGHSVGLCQWGAYFKGKNGMPYEDILRHYYSGIQFIRLY